MAGINHQVVSLLLPQVLQFLLLRPVAKFLLSFLGFIQKTEKFILPDFKALRVHKPTASASGVVADQLDSSGDVEDVFTLSSTETQEILEIIQKYSTESQFIEDGGGTLGAEQVISWR